jgi:hypothetical protein
MPTGPVRVLIISLLALACRPAGGQGVSVFPPQVPESNGQAELSALAAAFPGRIRGIEQHDGDWAVNVDGQWFDWAHARILPDKERGAWGGFAPYRFYRYTPGVLPPLTTLSVEQASALMKALQDARARPPRRSEAFLQALFQARSRAETESRLVTVSLLGFHVQVHELAAGALRDVAADCDAAAAVDPTVDAFRAGLAEIDGFNYRDVAGTFSRSYHSYGLAVDLIPKSYAGRATYWRWVMAGDDRWWATPYEKRWRVPQIVVDAFERHGFVWGGKWLFFDTMHFEYRPEVLALARLE